MQSMQRSFGKLLHKSPGDNAKVAVLLNDYEDADRVLAKLIEQTKSWRESWINIAMTQLGVITEYDGLWDPIVGATDGHGKPSVPTPELQLERTLKLKNTYTELKAELLEEVGLIESNILRPATDARDCIAPLRKTIKKRENKRLDYEKSQDRVNKLQRKPGRTAKEDATLSKAEAEESRAAEEFNFADSHLRETLPPLVSAIFSIIPPLLGSIIMIQNRLLGVYYTALHNYCEDYSFPSPPPPMEDVIAMWSADYEPIKREVESITCIATGKAVRQPMKLPDDPSNANNERKPSSSSTSSVGENGFHRPSSGLISSGGGGGPPTGPRPNRIPSSSSIASSQGQSGMQPRPSFANSNHLTPTDFTTASRLGQTSAPTTPSLSPTSTRQRTDYFSRSPTAPAARRSPSPNAAAASAVAASIAGKKKPPPPPPKRIGASRPDEFVIAQYTFTGQGAGDLSFREGDRIKVVKKTDTDQDWWIGELSGVKGSFPANYCKTA
ncbi:hypothetical protein F4779DRAFT_570039 [Xylariaceae sp. FL0662B]|nr:hypothetical protein F4779DRAFT_570039 [Xylariaceae sp. FL0662B]